MQPTIPMVRAAGGLCRRPIILEKIFMLLLTAPAYSQRRLPITTPLIDLNYHFLSQF
ncbi:hypothetical protein BDW74DRAFT_153321 [Aspergillus multicolor]|uniref:uncharacterized protein n=1 Tax=Aspergillus multicolor TaxID=41759 RepID=UPI003CCE45AB